MQRLSGIALMLGLLCIIEAQAQGLDIGGPLYECRPSWDFGGGGVHAHFSKGQLTGQVSQPPRFEVSHYCGGSSLTISFSAFVKNISMRVAAGGGSSAYVSGWGSINPGGSGTIVTIAGPTAVISLWSIGDGSVLVDRITFELAEQPALFSFGATTTGRVLTHKYRSDDAYPSAKQTEDAKILVEGLVHDLTGTNGISGRKVYFRLIDPADTADYTKKNGDAKPGDNADGPGTLSTATAVSDSNGKVSVTLGITDHAAGDNYQIEAALDQEFKCTPAPCQKSIVYTAWKRVYVEESKMFRKGAYITGAISADAGTTRLTVSDISQFHTGDTIRLIHAPPRQTVFGPPAPTPTPQFDFYSEEHVITVRPQTTLQGGTIVPPHLELQLLSTGAPDVLQYSYGPDASYGGGVNYLADAVGVMTPAGPLVFPLDDAFLGNLFEEAFVEYAKLPKTVEELPYQPILTGGHLAHLPFKWADASVTHDAGGTVRSRSNHQYVIGASRIPDPIAPNGKPGAELGQTPTTMGGFSRSWIWSGRIEAAVGEASQPIYVQSRDGVMREVVVHEIVHQWKVSAIPASSNITVGHCLEQRYQQDGRYCLMHMPFNETAHNLEFSDGAVVLHYSSQNAVVDSEYITIRRAIEPVPVQ